VGPAAWPARAEPLRVTDQQAELLGVPAGPLTAERLADILANDTDTGLLQRLPQASTPEKTQELVPALAALWEILVPEGEREALLEGRYQRLVVVPDGLLAPLPLEVLVVQKTPRVQMLLDVGPPVLYVPSGTVLGNLLERPEGATPPAKQPVLTVGDCRYGDSPQEQAQELWAAWTPARRYSSLGGRLTALQHAGQEMQWVAEVFGRAGTKVAWLPRELATEAAVRYNLPGRRIVHFACHGLVDGAWGNLFGALALTPGPNPQDPANDGFLTLGEIYELPLQGCELVILGACQTNVGPQQWGEGVWALSRGFLVAGSRRVVASQWLLDDEAAASMVSVFCAAVAEAHKEGRPPDYAAALQKAKRWVRRQPEWQEPHFWAPLVLIGPHRPNAGAKAIGPAKPIVPSHTCGIGDETYANAQSTQVGGKP